LFLCYNINMAVVYTAPEAGKGRHTAEKAALKRPRFQSAALIGSLLLSPIITAAQPVALYTSTVGAYDFIKPPSDAEKTIAHGLTSGLGMHVKVRCLDDAGMNQRTILNPGLRKHEETRGMAIPHVPILWLGQKTCNQVAAFAARPPQVETDIDYEQMGAIHDTAHEAAHAAGEPSEAKAQCIGLQTSANLAVGLGAPAELASTLTTRDYFGQKARQEGIYTNEQVYSPEYDWTKTCDGGNNQTLRALIASQ
jgi:hypothetical protein